MGESIGVSIVLLGFTLPTPRILFLFVGLVCSSNDVQYDPYSQSRSGVLLVREALLLLIADSSNPSYKQLLYKHFDQSDLSVSESCRTNISSYLLTECSSTFLVGFSMIFLNIILPIYLRRQQT